MCSTTSPRTTTAAVTAIIRFRDGAAGLETLKACIAAHPPTSDEPCCTGQTLARLWGRPRAARPPSTSTVGVDEAGRSAGATGATHERRDRAIVPMPAPGS